MKHLQIPFINTQVAEAELIPECLDQANIEWHPIDAHNWAEDYPYKPDVRFRIAHTGTEILIHYDVHEACIRAIAPADNGPVWKDACCEFFIQPSEENIYYNLECNCAGTLLIGTHINGEHGPESTQEILQGVKRWTSLGNGPKPLQDGDFHWQLALRIPASTFFLHHITQFNGLTAHSNFFKCGDELTRPHFLSWNKVEVPKPNFHRPDFFGECTFE